MKARANYMPPEQFQQVIEAIPRLKIRKWKDEDVQMMFKIDYWCALRFDEGLHLKAESFDLDVNEVLLGKTKTEKGDKASIPEIFKPELERYLIGKSGSLFPGLTYGTAIVWVNKLGKMLDILAWTTSQEESGEKTKTHIFRKSIGKDMIYGTFDNRKAPVTFVSQTLRHKGRNPLAMTIKYLKIGDEDVKDWWKQSKSDTEQINLD